MKIFKLNVIVFVSFTAILTFNSCTNESANQILIETQQVTAMRSSNCPQPIVNLETISGSPCASLKLVYSGTDDPESDCTFKSIDIKTFKTWDPNEVKTFESTIVFGLSGSYPTRSHWYSTIDGRLLYNGGDRIGETTTITNVTGRNANTSFEYNLPANPDNGPYNWVCVKIILECDNTECAEYKTCFNTYTPCI